jgi:hypothetical protein
MEKNISTSRRHLKIQNVLGMPIFDRKRQGIANRCKGDGLLRLWTLLEKRMQTLNGYILSIPKPFQPVSLLQTKK